MTSSGPVGLSEDSCEIYSHYVIGHRSVFRIRSVLYLSRILGNTQRESATSFSCKLYYPTGTRATFSQGRTFPGISSTSFHFLVSFVVLFRTNSEKLQTLSFKLIILYGSLQEF